MRVLPDLLLRRPLLLVAVGHFVRELPREPVVARLVRLRHAIEVLLVETVVRLLRPRRAALRLAVSLPLLPGRPAINKAREPVEGPGVHHDLAGLEGLDRFKVARLREGVLLPGRVGYLAHQPLALFSRERRPAAQLRREDAHEIRVGRRLGAPRQLDSHAGFVDRRAGDLASGRRLFFPSGLDGLEEIRLRHRLGRHLCRDGAGVILGIPGAALAAVARR